MGLGKRCAWVSTDICNVCYWVSSSWKVQKKVGLVKDWGNPSRFIWLNIPFSKMVRVSECKDWRWRNWVFFWQKACPAKLCLHGRLHPLKDTRLARSCKGLWGALPNQPPKNMSKSYCQYFSSNEKIREKKTQTQLLGHSVENKTKKKKMTWTQQTYL